MARNEEKAQGLMNRWTTMKQELSLGDRGKRRPFLTTDCTNLSDAERFRRQVIRNISKKVQEIQNAGLGEHVIRDLNDQINYRMKEKYRWEKRIAELGGPHYHKLAQPDPDEMDGKELRSSFGGGYKENVTDQSGPGYKYFGAAKNLPGVRELFAQEAEEKKIQQKKRSRHEIYQRIEPDYYGYRDDEDGVLAELEGEEEKEQQQLLLMEWETRKEALKKAKQELGYVNPEDE